MNRFVIAEPAKCIGCNTCMAACVMVHKAVGLQACTRLMVTRTQEGTAPILCRHCEDAHCARVCPVGAITHDGDSVVLNESTCIGCKLCAIACPFGAITPHGTSATGVASNCATLPALGQPSTGAVDSTQSLGPLLAWVPGVRNVAVKCDLCSFSEMGPECVRVCPTKALYIADDKAVDRASDIKRKQTVISMGDNLPPLPAAEQK